MFCFWPMAAELRGAGATLRMFKEAGGAATGSGHDPGSRSGSDEPRSASWKWKVRIAWRGLSHEPCRPGGAGGWRGAKKTTKIRQLIFGSRWGATLSTGAAQMPLKQSNHRQLSRDPETHRSLTHSPHICSAILEE